MQKPISVSLILPSLNVAPYMRECLTSVVRQTLPNIEILCVDAGSTDGTLDIIREFVQQDSRVKLVLSEKKSYGHQMNLGIQHAQGEYIGIVETDDHVPLNMYEDLYRLAVDHRAEIVKADFYRFRAVGAQIERMYNRLDASDSLYGKVFAPADHPEVFRCIMNTWSGIYQRAFLSQNNILHNETPGASYQDNGFWFRTFCCARRLLLVDRPYYMNRRDNVNSSVSNPGKVYCMTEEWNDIYRWLKEDHERFRRFIGPYTLKKYHSLLFTYARIDPKYREAFIVHMGEELKHLLDAGEYDRSAFTLYEWKRFNLIARFPERYHQLCLSRCSHVYPAKLVSGKLSARKRLCGLIRRADRILNKLEIIWAWVLFDGPVKTVHRVRWKNVKSYTDKED